MEQAYPKSIEIPTRAEPIRATVDVPGSKSITNRAFVLAALSRGPSRLRNVLDSEDTRVMMDALRGLGFGVVEDSSGVSVERPHSGALIPNSSADLFVENSGTSMRFLTALVSLGSGTYRLDGIPRMRERPIRDLLDALKQLGVEAVDELGNGCPPVRVEARGIRGGEVRIRGDISSQFLTALLMVAPCAEERVIVRVEGELVSVPYVEMTLAMMARFGVDVEREGTSLYRLPVLGGYRSPEEYYIEPDASAASYFFGLAAVSGGRIGVRGLSRESLQGDVRFVDALEQMGCRVEWFSGEANHPRVVVEGGALRGIDIDMNAISDTVMTLGVVACFAEGPTTIRNVGHIRHKETDRIEALATELRRVGAEVEERPDGLTIHPRALHSATIRTYNDHRMAMSFSLLGVRVPGIVIDDPQCVRKTYPHFFDDFFDVLRS